MLFRMILICACGVAVAGCGGTAPKKLTEAEQKEANDKMKKDMEAMGTSLPAKLPTKGQPAPAAPAAPK